METIKIQTLYAMQQEKPDIVILYGDIFDFQWAVDINGRKMHFIDFIRHISPDIKIFAYLTIDAKYNSSKINLQVFNRVLVTTQFGANECQNSLPYVPEYVYHGVDPDFFYPLPKNIVNDHKKKNKIGGEFIVMAFSRNQYRKNWPATFKIFGEFAKDKNAKLLLLTELDNPFGTHDLRELISRYGCNNKIIYHPISAKGGISDSQLNVIYNTCDLFMTTSFSEGFLCPLLEAAACGKSSIGPDYSGHGEIIKKSGGFPVSIEGYVCQEHLAGNMSDREFAVVNEREFIDKLNYLYNNPHEIKIAAQKALSFAKEHSWIRSANKIMEIIK